MDKCESNVKKDDCRFAEAQSAVDSGHFEIKAKGHVDEHWTSWFGYLAVTQDECGYSILTGFIPDQSALHGILGQIRDLSLTLISVTQRVPDT